MLSKTTYLIFTAAVIVSAFSCVPQRKASAAKTQLAMVDSQLVNHQEKLKDLEKQRQQKQDDNEIGDTASVRIQKFIDKTKAEINALHGENTILIGDLEINKNDWDRLRKSLSASRNASRNINDKITMLSDLINRNTVINLDQDVIFEPGKYTVTPAVVSAIGKFFEPAAKEIDMFVQKYPDFPMSLVITAKGYADGTTIAEGTPLYKDLTEKISLSGRPPTSENLNKELSTARAKSVIDLFTSFTAGRSGSGRNIDKIIYMHEGKGEALPNPKITDYKVDDARRRIVLLFWSVFPD
jgi:flagellar motor protein MotB